MSFENVKIIDSPLELATLEEVNAIESQLNLKFPSGYREYVTALGHGAFCQYVRVFMPSQILIEYKEYQNFWNNFFSWDKRPDVLPKKKVIESVTIADSYCGDQVIFHPDNTNELFLLPHGEEEMIEKIGSNFYEALDCLCGLQDYEFSLPTEKKYFVPESWYKANRGKSWEGDL